LRQRADENAPGNDDGHYEQPTRAAYGCE
jgi:hypothetical protein